MEIVDRSRLERELLEAQCKASWCREEEKRFRGQAETEEAREKWLLLQLGSLNIE